jgi:hypothetical protein
MKIFSYLSLVVFLLYSQSLIAQNSKKQLSHQAANPLADLMSFPFQNNLNINYGPYKRNMNILNIQPVIPFAQGKIIIKEYFIQKERITGRLLSENIIRLKYSYKKVDKY